MAEQKLALGRIFAVLVIVIAIMGGVVYKFVLPRFQQGDPTQSTTQQTQKKKGFMEKVFPSKPVKATSLPQIGALPGTTPIRLAHWTWNSHQAWAMANMGKITDPGSIFARNGITLQFHRMEEIPNQIASLKAFATAFNRGEANPSDGVHFFTIMGDAGGWVMSDTNEALKEVNPSFEAEIIGFSGCSSGEDKFMGPPEWKQNPQSAKGGVVAGVPCDGDWNIMIFWCAQNQIPFNPDERYYDPNALNFLSTDSYVKAGDVYISNKPVQRIFRTDGMDYQGNPVTAGKKGFVPINGSVTWTPVDKNIADQRGGLVSIASTKEYSNQMPQFVIGLKQWNNKNRDAVVKMLASIFEAADLVLRSDRDLKAGRIQPQSENDYRWKAAKYTYQIFDSESPDYWYTYYNVVTVQDRVGLTVDVGGSSVSNLQRNLKFFGLDGGTDIGKVIYDRFAQLAKHYYPDFIDEYPRWESVFNRIYLQSVRQQFPMLEQTDANLPTFAAGRKGEQLGELTYRIPFDSGKATFTSEAETILREGLEQLVIAANSSVEIHGHTDSSGSAESNMLLSRRRGQSVYNWLRERAGSSFPQNRVRVVAHGEDNLLVSDQVGGRYTPDKMAQNRRVVLKIFASE